jgi:hypothetical protein
MSVPGTCAALDNAANTLPKYIPSENGTPILGPSGVTDDGTTLKYKGVAVQTGSALSLTTTGTGGATTLSAGILNVPTVLNETQTTVGGSTSGSGKFSQPFRDASYKKVVINLATLVGTVAYTFPVPFTVTPDSFIGATAAGAVVSALSTTAVTITGTTQSGVIVLEGY